MRRTIGAIGVALAALALLACEPATVTANASTLRPACDEITTVSGVGSPAKDIRNVVIEIQSASGEWKPWKWFRTGASGETWVELRKSVNADGTYSLTYYRPRPGSGTVRLRVRGTKLVSDPGGVVSKSWYVTAPVGC